VIDARTGTGRTQLSGESREAVAYGWSGRLTSALRRFRPAVRIARSSAMGSMNGPERRAQRVNRTSSAVPTTADPDSRVVAMVLERERLRADLRDHHDGLEPCRRADSRPHAGDPRRRQPRALVESGDSDK
jgi:hypothetical protein